MQDQYLDLHKKIFKFHRASKVKTYPQYQSLFLMQRNVAEKDTSGRILQTGFAEKNEN